MLHEHGPRAVLSREQGFTILLRFGFVLVLSET